MVWWSFLRDPSTQEMARPMPDVVYELDEAIAQAASRYYRLVLLVGPHGSGKTVALRRLAARDGTPLLNLSREVSQAMLAMTGRQRATQADRLVRDLVANTDGGVVLLDDIELLFLPSLQVDPLRVLQGASRNVVLLAAWSGSFDGGVLTYAAPDHPEYRSYRDPDAAIVSVQKEPNNGGAR